MKTIRIFGTRGLILAAALGVSIGVGFVPLAFADIKTFIISADGKSVTSIGAMGIREVEGKDINDSGQVVGSFERTGTHAFITGPNGRDFTDLGTRLGGDYSHAAGINNIGQVTGVSVTIGSDAHAYITGPNGVGVTPVGPLGVESLGRAINASGQVAGIFSSNNAFITGPNGVGLTDLGNFGSNAEVTGVNATGQMVGWSSDRNGRNHAFITGPDGVGRTDLGSLGHLGGSEAWAINDAGQVVGWTDMDNRHRAFITGPNGVDMTALGTLDNYDSVAYGINNAGQVVGGLEEPGAYYPHAFITGPNGEGITDLHSLLDPFLPEPYYTSTAIAINNTGQVLVITSPIPEPTSYALMLAGLALVGFMARQNKEHRIVIKTL